MSRHSLLSLSVLSASLFILSGGACPSTEMRNNVGAKPSEGKAFVEVMKNSLLNGECNGQREKYFADHADKIQGAIDALTSVTPQSDKPLLTVAEKNLVPLIELGKAQEVVIQLAQTLEALVDDSVDPTREALYAFMALRVDFTGTGGKQVALANVLELIVADPNYPSVLNKMIELGETGFKTIKFTAHLPDNKGFWTTVIGGAAWGIGLVSGWAPVAAGVTTAAGYALPHAPQGVQDKVIIVKDVAYFHALKTFFRTPRLGLGLNAHDAERLAKNVVTLGANGLDKRFFALFDVLNRKIWPAVPKGSVLHQADLKSLMALAKDKDNGSQSVLALIRDLLMADAGGSMLTLAQSYFAVHTMTPTNGCQSEELLAQDTFKLEKGIKNVAAFLRDKESGLYGLLEMMKPRLAKQST